MEKYMGNLRLILCATSTSKIIAPIRSRCLLIRVPAPDEKQVSSVRQRGRIGAKLIIVSVFVSPLLAFADDGSTQVRSKEGKVPPTRKRGPTDLRRLRW